VVGGNQRATSDAVTYTAVEVRGGGEGEPSMIRLPRRYITCYTSVSSARVFARHSSVVACCKGKGVEAVGEPRRRVVVCLQVVLVRHHGRSRRNEVERVRVA